MTEEGPKKGPLPWGGGVGPARGDMQGHYDLHYEAGRFDCHENHKSSSLLSNGWQLEDILDVFWGWVKSYDVSISSINIILNLPYESLICFSSFAGMNSHKSLFEVISRALGSMDFLFIPLEKWEKKQSMDGPNMNHCPESRWVCLKIGNTPKPNGFHDHYPIFKWLFHWEYTQQFQTNPDHGICMNLHESAWIMNLCSWMIHLDFSWNLHESMLLSWIFQPCPFLWQLNGFIFFLGKPRHFWVHGCRGRFLQEPGLRSTIWLFNIAMERSTIFNR